MCPACSALVRICRLCILGTRSATACLGVLKVSVFNILYSPRETTLHLQRNTTCSQQVEAISQRLPAMS
jgi:hypothetical protein